MRHDHRAISACSVLGLKRGARRRVGAGAALVAAAGLAHSAAGQSVFTGAGSPSTQWCVPGNWMPMQVPSAGAQISIGPGPAIDMFTCGELPYSIGPISAERRVRFWPTMNFQGGGTLVDPDLAMNVSSPSTITGALTATGTGANWTSGWIVGGTLVNTGTMRAVQLGGPGHNSRTLGSGSRLTNNGRLEIETGIALRDGGGLNNGGELVFLPVASGSASIDYNALGPSGSIVDLGTITVGPGAAGFIRTDYIGQGAINVNSGSLEFFGGARDFAGTSFNIQGGGTVMIGGNTIDRATFFEATASGTGQLRLEGSELELDSLTTNFSQTLGNGLWFSHGTFPCRLGAVAADGLASWSQGTLENLSGQPPTLDGAANLTVGPQGLLRIGTPVEGGGPGFLDRMKLLVRGDVNQQADLRLRNGAIVVVEQDADWFMPSPRGLRGEPAPTTFVLRGDLFVIPTVSPFATIANVVVSMEGSGRLSVGDTRLEVNNLITTANPIRMLDQSVLDISTIGEVRLQNRLVAASGSPRWIGSGKLITVGSFSTGTTIISIDDGASLTNELSGSGPDDGFFLGHELRAGGDDPELLGFSPSFLNAGKMVWLNGEVSIRNDLDEGFVNLGDLFIRSGANHRLVDCWMVNQSNTFHEDGVLVLGQRGFFRNQFLYSMTGGSITRAGGATIGSFVNTGTGLINKTQATAATISAPLDNAGRVSVLEGSLAISGPITQVTGPAQNATLTGGRWSVGPAGTLTTPGVTIRTLGAGGEVLLEGDWPQFQPGLVLGNLTLNGFQVFPGGLSTAGTGSVAVNGNVFLDGPVVVGGGVVVVNGTLSAASLTLNSGIVIENGPIGLEGALTINGGIFEAQDRVDWDDSPASVIATGGRIEGTGEFGDPADAPVAFDCSGCTLAPGNSPGNLTIHGSLALGDQSVTEIEIASPSPPNPGTQHDVLTVTGPTTLGGTLAVRLLDGFIPVPGDAFTVLTSGAASGSFATVQPPATLPPALRMALEISPSGVTIRFACAADFNADGDLNADDLADYINCYFSVPPCDAAEFNRDGDINADDLGDYINAYFAGCN